MLGAAGVRAMIYALGAVRALSRMGVLGVVTYSASLSGSAWMQTLWMSMLGRVEVSACLCLVSLVACAVDMLAG